MKHKLQFNFNQQQQQQQKTIYRLPPIHVHEHKKYHFVSQYLKAFGK